MIRFKDNLVILQKRVSLPKWHCSLAIFLSHKNYAVIGKEQSMGLYLATLDKYGQEIYLVNRVGKQHVFFSDFFSTLQLDKATDFTKFQVSPDNSS